MRPPLFLLFCFFMCSFVGGFLTRISGIRGLHIVKKLSHYALQITPHAILLPAFPEGCVVKSSGPLWITTDLPMISLTQNLPVNTWQYARPLLLSNGGRSPA